MKVKLTELKDGRIKLEVILRLEYVLIDGTVIHENPPVWFPQVNDEGCFVLYYDVFGDDNIEVALIENSTGVPGNLNHSICRLHGWRGATNNRACMAMGWRKVESVTPRKRGAGLVAIYSNDLKPTED